MNEASKTEKFKIGDTYSIIENGKRLSGRIVKLTHAGMIVDWSDGTRTLEPQTKRITE